MAKTISIPITIPREVNWSAEFDNSPRHCWTDLNGNYHVEKDWDTICLLHAKHPKLAGQVEWMRFIREVNSIIAKASYDQEVDDMSTVGGFGSPTQLGRDLHDNEDNHWPGFECYPDWIVYHNHDLKVTRIELHNPDLISVAEQAYKAVQDSYNV